MATVDNGQINVLLIEDDSDYATLVRQALSRSRRAHLAVSHAGTLSEACQALEKTEFDILLVDLGLPDGEGLAAVEQVKAKAPQTPFIVLTGLESEDIGLEAVRRGAQDYLVKRRVNAEALTRCIQYVVERTGMEKRRAAHYAVTSVLAQCRHLREATKRIIQVICQTASFDLGEMFVVARDKNVMHYSEGWSKQEIDARDFLAAGLDLEISESEELAGRVWALGRPLWIENVSQEPWFVRKPQAARAGLTTVCAFPISFHNEMLAVMCFYSRASRKADRDLLEMLTSIGSQIGQFMERESAEESAREVVLMRLREDFMATLAHDLKTPLIGADRLLGLLLSGKLGQLDESHAELLGQLRGSNENLLRMVRNLVDVYRFESGVETLDLQTVDLRVLVLDCLKELSSLAEEKCLTVTASLPENIGRGVFDELAMRRVITNLLSNALKFTPEGGAVNISLGMDGSRLVLQVKDTGIGIRPDEEKYLFQRFWRGGQRNKAIGSGLGLHLCRQIVEAHGGTIVCTSGPDRGTTFSVFLPVATGPVKPGDTLTNIIIDRKKFAGIPGKKTAIS